MKSDRFTRLGDLFARARELPVAERGAYLLEACGDDSALRQEVEELLETDARRTGDAVDRALGDDEDLAPGVGHSTPRRIGAYRVLGICGSGGMGTVYEAEQESTGRRVALKVILSGTVRRDLLHRFRREAEILARLQHPGIARVFEAGEFSHEGASRPYFAMEFVDGEPLLAHATRHALGLRERIDLFVQICDALHYAHEQGVVHRDVKPDNVFVVEAPAAARGPSTGAGRPKILDFGVARVADSRTQLTMATGAGQLLGSVPYMSPEQATGSVDRIDARSDLYGLGVLLFELLTGRLPHDVRRLALADALHAIRHEPPARLGAADPALRGDLETIVGKCLEKDPERRYASASALAEDLRRYTAQQPIAARPPTTWHQLARFAERNRALVLGASTACLAITVGAVLAVLFGLNANEHARAAHASRVRSEHEAYRANITAASALLESDPAQARRILTEIPADGRGWEWSYLSSALSAFLLEFGEVVRRGDDKKGETPAEHMALLEGGAQVLGLHADHEFGIWNTRTGEFVRAIEAPAYVERFAVARSGSLLAAALDDGRVVVADPREATPNWTTWFESDTPVGALAVSPTGDAIAIDRLRELCFGRPGAWHVTSGGRRASKAHAPALEFSRDGTTLVSLRKDLSVYDVTSGERVGAPIGSSQRNWSMALAPDGTTIAAGQHLREVRVFDRASQELRIEFFGHYRNVRHVAYGSRDRLLSVSADDTIRVWNLHSREQLAVFPAAGTSEAGFVDDDHVLSLTNGRFRLWTLRDRRARRLEGHAGRVFTATFSGDGSLLATSAPWSEIIVWDPLDSAPLRSFPAKRREQLAFERAGERLLSSRDSWQARSLVALPWSGEDEIGLDLSGRGFIHRATSRRGLSVDGSTAPYEPGELSVFRTEHVGEAAGDPARAFCDGRALDLGPPSAARDVGPHPMLHVGGLRGSAFRGTISELVLIAGRLSEREAEALDEHLSARRAGESSELPALGDDSNARLFAHFQATEESVRCGESGSVEAWAATNDARLELEPHGHSTKGLAFLPARPGAPAALRFSGGWNTGRWLELALPQLANEPILTICWLGAYGADSSTQLAYGLGTHHVPFADSDRDERVWKLGNKISYSPDGRYVAIVADSSQRASVTVRDSRTAYTVAHFPGSYHGVGFHPDSTRLACAARNGHVDVYDVEREQRVATIDAHADYCYDAAFSPDGSRLATAGNDNALRIWDAETYEPLLDLPGHGSYVRGVAWSPDGTMLVSTCGDFVVRVWDSVSREERYRQRLANDALAEEVRARVETLRAVSSTCEDARSAIRREWPDDAARRLAALKVLARLRAPTDSIGDER